MIDWLKDHPEFVWIASVAIFGWAFRWLRKFIKNQSALVLAAVLAAIAEKKFVTNESVTHSLTEIRSDIKALGTRLDQHLERCHQPAKKRR